MTPPLQNNASRSEIGD